MNANELADMIDSDNWVGMDDQEHIEWEMKAAVMLRQQADRIAELEKESANLEHSLKNALIFIDNHKQTKPLSDDYQNKYIEQYWLKKPLSDEEIEEHLKHCRNGDFYDGFEAGVRWTEAKVRGEK